MKTEKIKKILVINDNVEDVEALKKALPSNIAVKAMSQFEASLIQSVKPYNLIILDNDANEAKQSKGQNTLKEILKKKEVPNIVYTSFSPAWVSKEVSNNSNITVVNTKDIAKYLSNIYGIPVKEVAENKPEGKTSLIITYNPVDNYESGIYGNGKLLIVSNTKHAESKAPEVTQKNLEKIFGTFNFKTDKDKIKDIYVYVGLHAIDEPLSLAMSLAHDVHKQVYVMACHCDWAYKAGKVKGLDIILHEVTCGGGTQLMQIADNILGRSCGKKITEKK